MKTSKSLQLLDVQNNNISPAVGVDSIFYEKTKDNITNRYPLTFISELTTSGVENSMTSLDYISFVSINVLDGVDSSVYSIDVKNYPQATIKNWLGINTLENGINRLDTSVNSNATNIGTIQNHIKTIDDSINTVTVKQYFNDDSVNKNSPHQRSGLRIAAEAVRKDFYVNGVLHGFPSLKMMNDTANTKWYNNYKNSSYFSLGIGYDVSTGWDNNTGSYTGEQKYYGANYYYTHLINDKLFNASLYLNYKDASDYGGVNGDASTEPDSNQYWKIIKAPTIQIDENKRFPYLPGYHPSWLKNGASYLLALAADSPTATNVNNDTPVHMAWINSDALNNTAASQQLISEFWNTSIGVAKDSSTVKEYVNASINNTLKTIRQEINSSLNASIGALGTSTVKAYVDSSISNSLPKLNVWKTKDDSSVYYLLSTKSHVSNANLKNDFWVCADQLWYIQQNNLYGGNVYSTSDENLKHDIENITDDELTFKPKSFKWDENDKQSYGFIAQEIEKDYPELVSNGADGFKRVNYDAALSLIVGKLINKIEKLEARISELENK